MSVGDFRTFTNEIVDAIEDAAATPVIINSNAAILIIANGATTSSAIDARLYGSFGIIIPTAFTGTFISFSVCDTASGVYQGLYDRNGTLVQVPVVQGRSYSLPGELTEWPYFKIVSSSNEGGERSLIIVTKG